MQQTAADRMLWDTVNTEEERPRLLDALEGHDYLTSIFLLHGVYVGGLNIVGEYGENYAIQAVGIAAVLGFLSAAWGFAELATGKIAEDGRPGFARERSIMWYTSSYLAGVMWLSLRLSPLYPASLTPLDPALCAATIAVYVYGFASPVRTVLVHWEELTATEQLRLKGMVASGAVGGVFVLNTAALLLRGNGWWEQVLLLWPGQSTLEPSTALFAAYAVEAGMLVHRAARKGLITFQLAVPFYGLAVLPLLTVLPMGCLFWWRQADISFWSFLFI